MGWLQAIILGIVEGITEFLPISSTAHLNLVEKLMGYAIDDAGITAFTAIIQVGAIVAAIIYFWGDIVRIIVAWFHGLLNAEARQNPNYQMGWAVIVGSIPVAVVGLVFKNAIETTLKNLWVIALALILWSVVMWFADRQQNLPRSIQDVTWQDGLILGCFQALAPVFPGVSRSGATISGGLFRKLERVSATKLSFLLGIPALVAAGGLEAATQAKNVSVTVGWGPTVIATVVSLIVAYVAIAWLLRFVSKNNFTGFIIYRVILGVLIIGLIAAKVVGV